MIEYYSSLIKSLGGKVNAYYLDGIAVYNCGQITSFMDSKTDSFYMIDAPSGKRHAGWPLDSISLNKNGNTYFADKDESESKDSIFINDYRRRIISFLKDSLKL